MKLAPSERAALRAYARTGDQRRAADDRGVSYQTLKNECCTAYRKLGVTNAIDAFRKLGWLTPR